MTDNTYEGHKESALKALKFATDSLNDDDLDDAWKEACNAVTLIEVTRRHFTSKTNYDTEA